MLTQQYLLLMWFQNFLRSRLNFFWNDAAGWNKLEVNMLIWLETSSRVHLFLLEPMICFTIHTLQFSSNKYFPNSGFKHLVTWLKFWIRPRNWDQNRRRSKSLYWFFVIEIQRQWFGLMLNFFNKNQAVAAQWPDSRKL